MSKKIIIAMLLLASVVCVTLLYSPMSWATPPLLPFSYEEDFETEDGFEPWVNNGTYTVNFKGITSERSSNGSKSLKIDVSLDTATYLYYRLPVNIPSIGTLQFSGDIYIESITGGVSVSLGTNVLTTPYTDGGVHTIERLGNAGAAWITQSSDLVSASLTKAEIVAARGLGGGSPDDIGKWTSHFMLNFFASSPGRIVVYVDNISVQGNVPSISEYESYTQSTWDSYLSRVQAEWSEWTTFISNFDVELSDPEDIAYVQTAKSRTEEIRDNIQPKGFPSPADYEELKTYAEALSYFATAGSGNEAMNLHPWSPITSEMILPDTYPIMAPVGNLISIKACPGEYEPASFVIRSVRSVSNVMVTATDLVSPAGQRIPLSEVDIRLVKCWYQAGRDSIIPGAKTLVSELLLKDDSLVRVDLVQQTNEVKVTVNGQEQYLDITSPTSTLPADAVLKDAASLQPFAVDKDKNKLVWITVHIPEGTAAGNYEGTLTVTPTDAPSQTLTLTVEVLPFELQPSVLEYGLYYRGRIRANPSLVLNSDYKTSELYRKDLENMKKHGVLYPTIYDSGSLLGEALSIRSQVGLPKDKYYTCALKTGNATETAELDTLKQQVTDEIALARQYGFDQVFIYGKDEARGEDLLVQQAAWSAVHDVGANVFVACYEGAVDFVGDSLDVAVLNGYKPAEVAKWRERGKEVLQYHSPQVGVENPGTYRRTYGLQLWCGGYNGAMNYAYQAAFDHIWNDFDSDRYREHVFTYPTTEGVIDTVQWEGFREAIDDVRYLSTWLARAQDSLAVREWVCGQLSQGTDFSEIRNHMIQMIESISGTPEIQIPPPPQGLRVVEP